MIEMAWGVRRSCRLCVRKPFLICKVTIGGEVRGGFEVGCFQTLTLNVMLPSFRYLRYEVDLFT